MMVASVTFLFSGVVSRALGMSAWVIQLSSIALLAASFLYIARAFRCPSCRLNLLTHEFVNGAVGNFMLRALETTDCPRCRFPSVERTEGTRAETFGPTFVMRQATPRERVLARILAGFVFIGAGLAGFLAVVSSKDRLEALGVAAVFGLFGWALWRAR